MNPIHRIDIQTVESLTQKENLTSGEREDLSQFAANILSQAAPLNDPDLNSLLGRAKKSLETLKITEEELLTTYDFWGHLSEQGVKKLIIQTEEGSITYDAPVLRALQILKAELEDLTEKVTLTFSDGELVETKAKLRLCGDLFDELFEGVSVDSPIPLSFSKESFLSILEAVNLASYFRTDFPKETFRFKREYSLAILRFLMPAPIIEKNTDIAKYLLFPPKAILISHPHIFGQEHYEKFWGKIDPVPQPPQELLTFLDKPCPITKDGRKVIDTHKVFWIPKTVDGQPLTIDRIQEIARSDKFGESKVGYEYYPIQQQIGHLRIEGGCWVVVGLPLEETRGLPYARQCKILKAKCPGYEVVISAGHAIISCLVPFAASGEITLGTNPLTIIRCQEIIHGWQVCVGGLSRSGLNVCGSLEDGHGHGHVLVLPSRKFSGKLAI